VYESVGINIMVKLMVKRDTPHAPTAADVSNARITSYRRDFVSLSGYYLLLGHLSFELTVVRLTVRLCGNNDVFHLVVFEHRNH